MRYALRYKPDPLDTALIQMSNDNGFTPAEVGIILNESYTGSAVVISTKNPPKTEQMIKVQIGKLPQLAARIVWVKTLEPEIFKLGIEYLE